MTPPQTPAPAAAPITWARSFPGTADQVGQARRFLAGLLGGCEGAADAVLCLSELAANAVQHSRSAGPGGRFTVRVSRAGPWLRVGVTDDGGPWAPQPSSDGHGRGLLIVRSLAGGVRIGDPGVDSPGRTVTFGMRLG